MKRKICSVLITMNVLFLSAQQLSYTFGKVGIDDINYNSCEFEKNSDAVVMFDNASSNYFDDNNGGFEVVFERTTRIKILTDAGVKWGDIAVPFYYSNKMTEQIYDLKAYTYNLENNELVRSEFNTNNCYDEKINEFWMQKKFALPNVKKGSVIEFKYKIASPYVFKLRDWEFQWEIPVLVSQYTVNLIPFYQYNFILQGASKLDVHTSNKSTIERQFGSVRFYNMEHTFAMYNIPSFSDEGYITSKDDYIIKLNFQLSKVIQADGNSEDIITTWPKLCDELLSNENFGKYVNNVRKMTPKLLNMADFETMNPRQKFDSIINYIKMNYIWNKNERIYTSKKPTDLIKDKFGNSADINLFAVGLLNGVGLECYPVIISTRNHGKIKANYPFLDFFNNTLFTIKIDSTYVMADATDYLLSNDRIPINCINDNGLVVQKNKTTWINLHPTQTTRQRTDIAINLSDTTKKTEIILKSYEYASLQMRKKFGSNIKQIQKALVTENRYDDDTEISVKNENDNTKPYILSLKFKYIPEKLNNKIYVAPFLNQIIKENPFKRTERTHPIDMVYPEFKSFVSTIKIPENYKVEYLPANKKIETDQFELEYTATVNNEYINISMSYFFKKSEYPAKDYADLKMYFNEIIKKGADKIVLIKL